MKKARTGGGTSPGRLSGRKLVSAHYQQSSRELVVVKVPPPEKAKPPRVLHPPRACFTLSVLADVVDPTALSPNVASTVPMSGAPCISQAPGRNSVGDGDSGSEPNRGHNSLTSIFFNLGVRGLCPAPAHQTESL